MTGRNRSLRVARLSAVLAVAALTITAPGAVAAASADTTADPTIPTLDVNVLDRNRGALGLDPILDPDFYGLDVTILNGDKEMQPLLDGTERALWDYDLIFLDNLARGARYDISVRYTDAGTGEFVGVTNTVSFTTEPSTDTEPPTTPTNLHFELGPEPQLPGHYDVKWDRATDNVDSGSDIQYVVKRNGILTGPSTEAAPGDVFTVTAIDTSNNASPPATVIFTG